MPQFDVNNKIDDWDRLILLVKAKDLHSIQFKVIDVDREDAWGKIKDVLGDIVEAVIGKIKGGIPENLPLTVADSFGGAADDVQSFLLKHIAGGDKVLFKGSTRLDVNCIKVGASDPFTIRGNGTDGHYVIKFDVEKIA